MYLQHRREGLSIPYLSSRIFFEVCGDMMDLIQIYSSTDYVEIPG